MRQFTNLSKPANLALPLPKLIQGAGNSIQIFCYFCNKLVEFLIDENSGILVIHPQGYRLADPNLTFHLPVFLAWQHLELLVRPFRYEDLLADAFDFFM